MVKRISHKIVCLTGSHKLWTKWKLKKEIIIDKLYAGTVKCQNVCTMLFQWEQIYNCVQVYFWKNDVKFVYKFWKSHLTRTNIPVLFVILVLLNHNTVANVDQILLLKCHIFLIGNTHRNNEQSSDSWSGWFVWNQLPCAGMIAL